jgi:hypothetical protein
LTRRVCGAAATAGRFHAYFRSSPAPAVDWSICMVEVNIGEPALEIAPAEGAEMFASLIAGSDESR